MSAVQLLDQQRPVTAIVLIDGRRYRGHGSLVEGLQTVAILKLEPTPAPAPFSRQDVSDAQEVVS